jgi:hypothetical protein
VSLGSSLQALSAKAAKAMANIDVTFFIIADY